MMGTVSNCGMTEGHDLGLGLSEETRPEERVGMSCELCMVHVRRENHAVSAHLSTVTTRMSLLCHVTKGLCPYTCPQCVTSVLHTLPLLRLQASVT